MKKHTGEIIRKYGKYRVINCKNCKFIHINPIPTNEELQNFYENDYYQKTKPNYIIGNEKDIEYQNYTFDEKLDFLEKKFTSKTRRILDIGSGPGFFLRRAKKRGWKSFVIPKSKVFHDRNSFDKPINTYFRTRNYIFFNRVVLDSDIFFLVYFFKNIFFIFKDLFGSLRRDLITKLHLKSFLRGVFHGFFYKIPQVGKLDE